MPTVISRMAMPWCVVVLVVATLGAVAVALMSQFAFEQLELAPCEVEDWRKQA